MDHIICSFEIKSQPGEQDGCITGDGSVFGNVDSYGNAVAKGALRQQPRVTSTLIGARTIDQLETNLASIDVDLDAAVGAELNALTKPDLNYPWDVLPLGAGIQQGSCTINGVSAEPFVRQK